MKKFIQGATIVEVMISVFLLTFGVLALMAAQIRSVANVNEAEHQSVVAQATEALAEAMRINPTLTKKDHSYIRQYDKYIMSTAKAPGNSASAASAATVKNIPTAKALDKSALAKAHIDEFESILSQQLPNSSKVYYIICKDSSSPKDPTLDSTNNMSANCDDKGTRATIKVVWLMGGNSTTDTTNVYSYVLQVAD
jgi:type IV pilus modification protein pilV